MFKRANIHDPSDSCVVHMSYFENVLCVEKKYDIFFFDIYNKNVSALQLRGHSFWQI